MAHDQIFLHFPHSNLPKWNTFSPCNSTKPQTHFLSSFTQPGRSITLRVSAPKTRTQLGSPFTKRVGLAASFLPGGSWWALPELREDGAEPVEAMLALQRMWELVADERWVAFVGVGSLVIAALSEITMPSILAASIFSAQSGETVAFSRNALFLVLLCFTSGICSGLRSGCFGILNVTLVCILQNENIQSTGCSLEYFLDISYFDKERVGDLTSRLAADCQRLSHVIGNDLQLILRNTCQGTGAIINLMALSWPLALSALVICSILSAIFLVFGQYQRKAAKLIQDFTACANDVAQETLSSIRIVRAYGTLKNEFGRYQHWLQSLAFINVRESVSYGFWNLIFNTLYRSTQHTLDEITYECQVGPLVWNLGEISRTLMNNGHARGLKAQYSDSDKDYICTAVRRYVCSQMSCYCGTTYQSIGASEQIFQLMNLLPSDQFLAKGVKLQSLVGHIQFANMPVLEHLNFSIEANQVIAIVGLSGSGKSTLFNLLLRLYEPSSGQIYIDGFPLKELDIRWLRQNIGYVSQEPRLFHMDIKSNIKYGCPRNIKQEDIEWAAKKAYAHDFISSLPNGYKTLVDDNALSGGQKQRIAIARAILRDPVIMILDEATSALDSESEHYIKEVLYALKDESKTRTIIIIAHRLSTIKAADKIFVMDDGRIIEKGDHEELLLRDGLYAKLNKIQADILT
ncbi:ABC transporter B family member 26, chloroplastic isoform X3 [Cajanus cajan]|uniref:ABC transporter B family member 26, chloroplastic isoform X3 n=1 Tax=Cajanus cajan TaxID=3821 RepID=UPI0010FAEF23|nr:ABC transporter B family member 26, chloroplastic isoform X3 [Cajanus cajan]